MLCFSFDENSSMKALASRVGVDDLAGTMHLHHDSFPKDLIIVLYSQPRMKVNTLIKWGEEVIRHISTVCRVHVEHDGFCERLQPFKDELISFVNKYSIFWLAKTIIRTYKGSTL
jgi:hypothetical protein